MLNVVEELRFAGQIIIDKVDIITTRGTAFDVVGQVVAIELFEDLFSPFMTGTLTILETLDLMNLFPLVGEETLHLSFHTPTIDQVNYRDQRYYIYKMTDMQNAGERSNTYVLHFISTDAIIDLNTKLSRTFEGRVGDIAKKLLLSNFALNTKKPVNIEDAQTVTKFTANYWSPMKCMNYIAATARNMNNSASYLFFENSHGLNFISLDSMYSMPAMHYFEQNNYIREISKTGTTVKDAQKDYMKIQRLVMPDGFDYIDRSLGGMYGSQLITVDPITKKYSNKPYKGSSDFKKLKHLNEYPIISGSVVSGTQQAIIYMPKHYGNFNGYTDVTNASVIQQRTSLLKMSDAFKISITVLGRTDYTVGQKVKIHVPAKEPQRVKEDHTDKVMSGNYLISAMAHRIDREMHKIDMELIKESFTDDLNMGSTKK